MSVSPASVPCERHLQHGRRPRQPHASGRLTSGRSQAAVEYSPDSFSMATRDWFVDEFVLSRLHPGGQKRSTTPQMHWRRFLAERGLPAELPRPLSDTYDQLLPHFAFYLIAYRKSNGDPLVPGTISSYVAAIRSRLSLESGRAVVCDPIIPLLIKRLGQTAAPRRHRIAATKELIRSVITDPGLTLDVQVAVLTAFSAMLRVSEYTSRSTSAFDPLRTLLRGDVVVHPDFIRLELRHTKTDTISQRGQVVYIFNHPGVHSAYTMLLRYVHTTAHRTADMPLFMTDATPSRNAFYITRHIINTVLRRQAAVIGLDPTYLSSHSLRIGGATALADADVADRDIQFAGRWRSDVFLRYIRVSLRRLSHIASAVYVGEDLEGSFVSPSDVADVLDDVPRHSGRR